MLIKVKTVGVFGTTERSTEYKEVWINLNQIGSVISNYSEYRSSDGGRATPENLRYPSGLVPKLLVSGSSFILDMPYEKFGEWYESVKVVPPSNLRVARGGNV